jgi:UDP-N-acetylglucosamine--N-acetylmuramyl-(pentapeptide) pyrophosphoryl-undecaprenol N-acetylglucosamine transferase
MKILITGGHLTPALAFIEYVRQHHQETEIYFVGREFSQKDNAQKSQEENEVSALGAKFISFSAPKLERNRSQNIFLKIPELISSLVRALKIFNQTKPNVILVFGGYLAVPIALAAWLLRVPIIAHEQTHSVGLANAWIARLSQYLLLSHEDSKRYIPAQIQAKSIVVGNLLRPSLWKEVDTPDWMPDSKLPILFITGGNQGSQILNQVVGQVLPQLTKSWTVVHQCGAATKELDYEQYLQNIAQQMPASQHKRYVVKPWITASQMAWIYQHTGLVVSRAGANTVDELAAFNLPAILVPLPFAHHQEQDVNAQSLHQAKPDQIKVIPQRNFTATSLTKAVAELRPYATQHLAQKPKPHLKPIVETYRILEEVCQARPGK